jgi:hypothetical protein
MPPTDHPTEPRPMTLSFATFALGMGIFALLFGLVAACDRL